MRLPDHILSKQASKHSYHSRNRLKKYFRLSAVIIRRRSLVFFRRFFFPKEYFALYNSIVQTILHKRGAMNRPKFLIYPLGFLVLGAGIVWAGNTTLTTYYPAPTGNYNQLTSNYVSIGTSTMGQSLIVMAGGGGSGNVGIGTTTPGAKLSAMDSTNSQYYQLRVGYVDSTYDFGIGRRPDNGALQIQGTQIGNNNIALAPTSGNVGIGTTGPTTTLDVNGTTYT